MRSHICVAALVGLIAASGAQAADFNRGRGYKDGPVVVDSWPNAGDVFVRLRGLAVLPDSSTSDWSANAIAAVVHPDVSITDSAIPELDLTYFFTKNIAAELILGVTPHTVKGTSGLGTLGKVGDVWLLPPTLTFQYHVDTGTPFKPYIGAGVNYTIFFDENVGPRYTNFNLDNNWGFALQAGFDYKIGGNWFLNFDFKKLWLETDAHANVGGVLPVSAHVNIDPIIVGGGVGYRLGASYVPLK